MCAKASIRGRTASSSCTRSAARASISSRARSTVDACSARRCEVTSWSSRITHALSSSMTAVALTRALAGEPSGRRNWISVCRSLATPVVRRSSSMADAIVLGRREERHQLPAVQFGATRAGDVSERVVRLDQCALERYDGEGDRRASEHAAERYSAGVVHRSVFGRGHRACALNAGRERAASSAVSSVG